MTAPDPIDAAPVALGRPGAEIGARHRCHPPLAAMTFPARHALGRLFVQLMRSGRRAATLLNVPDGDGEPLVANGHVDDIARAHVLGRLGTHTVDLDVPGMDGLRRQRAGLEEPRRPEPAIDAYPFARVSHAAMFPHRWDIGFGQETVNARKSGDRRVKGRAAATDETHVNAVKTFLAGVAATAVAATPALAASVSAPVASPGYNWAAGAMKDLVAHHGWSARDAGTLGRRASRRELARGLAEIMTARGEQPPANLVRPSDVSATDPDVQALSWVSTIRLLGAPGAAFTPGGTVTGRVADITVVRVLGLTDPVRALNTLHTTNGLRLKIPVAFGQEVLAEQLGLRHNYPAQYDNLEINVTQPIGVADVAGMIDSAIHLSPWQLASMGRYTTIVLPNETANQRTVIQNALAQVGMPYVWGGVLPTPQTLFGARVAGGFDCSGLVWWAFKLNATAAAQRLGVNVRGRTADAMAWEAPSQKVALTKLRPGDLLFFGSNGPHTPRGGISHASISLGGGWIVQSAGSLGGVGVTYVPDWWRSGMAWGRRIPTMISGPVLTAVKTAAAKKPSLVTTPPKPPSAPAPSLVPGTSGSVPAPAPGP